jgi:hypothetical protein
LTWVAVPPSSINGPPKSDGFRFLPSRWRGCFAVPDRRSRSPCPRGPVRQPIRRTGCTSLSSNL